MPGSGHGGKSLLLKPTLTIQMLAKRYKFIKQLLKSSATIILMHQENWLTWYWGDTSFREDLSEISKTLSLEFFNIYFFTL